MCGELSEGGNLACGLDLCCSSGMFILFPSTPSLEIDTNNKQEGGVVPQKFIVLVPTSSLLVNKATETVRSFGPRPVARALVLQISA
jgi:hypothetical protein